jgi:hypothetical protein
MTDQNQGETQFDAFVKKNKFGLIGAAAVVLLIYANAGNGSTPQSGNGVRTVQVPQQDQQAPQQGTEQGIGPVVQGGDVPDVGYDPSGGGVTVDTGTGGGSGVDMDDWRRRQAQDDEQQRRRVETIREEERCHNADGTDDTVSIHTGC